MQSTPDPRLQGILETHPSLRDAPCVLILPPLWDHHGHIAALGALLEQADLRGSPTVEEALARAQKTAEGLPEGAWLEGFGWDQNRWEGRYPHRAALDAVFPDRPVLLRRVDGHAGWANTRALALAGFHDGTCDPPGGSLLREGGRLNGVILDSALETLAALIPAPSEPVIRRRILGGLANLRDAGLCGVTDMGLEASHIQVLRELDSEGVLPIAVEGFAWVKPGQSAFPAPHRGSRFALTGVKLFSDGALGSRGAALREPYSDAPLERGLALWDNADLARVLREASAQGLIPAIHAIGDRAAGQVLDALEGSRVRGARLEHAQILSPQDVERMRTLGVIAGIQPCHYLTDRPWAPERLGDRMAHAYRWGSLAAAGIPLLMGTDFPIELPCPARNFLACAMREDASERLTVDQVIAAYRPPAWVGSLALRTLAACDGTHALASSQGGTVRFVPAESGGGTS